MGGGTIFKAIGKSELQSINVLRVPDLLADRADSDLAGPAELMRTLTFSIRRLEEIRDLLLPKLVTGQIDVSSLDLDALVRSEEHTSELQSLMRISYAVFCLKKKK